MLREPDVNFVVHGGDLVDGENWWQAWWDTPFAPITQRWAVYPTTGNHDPEAGFRQRFVDRWPPYKISARGVDLFFLPWGAGTATATWLDRETAASTAPFKILVMHRPIWPASGGVEIFQEALFAASLPRIDLVLTGHNHVSQDSQHVVGGHTIRQIIEKSGPKPYACNPGAVNCIENSTGYLRVTIYKSHIDVQRRIVP
jgi:hypothetical protein